MNKIENKVEEEKIREYLKSSINLYSKARESIGIPLEKEKLEKLIDEIEISLFEDENTKGTFVAGQVQKFFNVIMNNFRKNGRERNQFLLLHEMTHLSSEFNREYNERLSTLKDELGSFKSVQKNENISGWDVAFGVIAIEEVLAQWCCEECNDAIVGKRRTKKSEEHEILGNKINIKTDFSNKDIYAPLEGYVEHFALTLGYKDLKEFARKMINGEESFLDKINENNAETVGYIGILCEGIYQQENFRDCGLPASDIPIAISYLESKKKNFDFPEGPLDD